MSRPQTPAYTVRRPPINSALNAAVGTGISRTGSPSKPVMSLEEWESKAPLTDEQIQSISIVKEKLGHRPLPEKFRSTVGETSAQGALSRPITPPAARPARISRLIHSPSPRSKTPSVPGTPTLGGSSHLAPLDPSHPVSINTPQQFHEHFTALTLSTEHEQDSLYRDHLAEIIGLREKCDALIDILKAGEGEVGDMLKALEYVEERSESLRGACEDLLEEQTHLLTHTSQLAHRLTFFTFLETAQRMLNSTKNDLVLQEDFLPMVKRLDECLGYLEEHRDFKDAEVYLLRYQQCMTRSMTLIKIFFVNSIKALGQEVAKRISDKGVSETAIQALIYTKFASLSSSIRPLIAELELRVRSAPNELGSLLAECHTAWVGTRQTLIGPRVNNEIGRMNPLSGDLIDLTRSGCSYLKQTCVDEFNLYKHFFLSGESQLYGFLEGLCDNLYDHLRPRILHEPSLEILCGVCTVLQALMVQDVNVDEDPDEVIVNSPYSTPAGLSPYGSGQEDYFSLVDETYSARQRRTGSVRGYSGSILTRRDVPRRQRKPLDRLHTEVLLRMVLQDAQTRLVFRAQALLRADVEYYVPKDGDLEYPEKIKGQSGKLVQRQVHVSLDPDDDDEPAFLSLPPTQVQETWYPSLRVTLWILSCLYTYIDSAVFDDLAQEAVITSRKNLCAASDLIYAKKDKARDAKLFLVRHLLILKEMTAGLELGRRDRRKEWQGITDFLKSLLDNASYMLGYGRGSVPKTTDLTLDARSDVDRYLKITCEELIQMCTESATKPLSEFIAKSTTYLNKTAQPDLSSQPFATAEKVKQVHQTFKDNVVTQVENWIQDLTIYLQDEETVNVLIPPVHYSIVEAYRQFHDLVRAEYDFSTAAGILTPAGVQNLLTSR